MSEQNELTTSEALVLQQIHEDGEDDINTIASQLGMSRNYVAHMVTHLRSKGLLAISNDLDELWVRLTRKGRNLVNQLWPDARVTYGYSFQ